MSKKQGEEVVLAKKIGHPGRGQPTKVSVFNTNLYKYTLPEKRGNIRQLQLWTLNHHARCLLRIAGGAEFYKIHAFREVRQVNALPGHVHGG